MADIRSVAEFSRNDVRAFVRSVEGRTLPASRLYELYSEEMLFQNRDPVSKKAFGTALGLAGQKLVMKQVPTPGPGLTTRLKQARCWMIRERWMPAPAGDDDDLPATTWKAEA